MKPGDLIQITREAPRFGAAPDFKNCRVGVVLDVTIYRPGDLYGNELSVLTEGERWSVPERWARHLPVDDR